MVLNSTAAGDGAATAAIANKFYSWMSARFKQELGRGKMEIPWSLQQLTRSPFQVGPPSQFVYPFTASSSQNNQLPNLRQDNWWDCGVMMMHHAAVIISHRAKILNWEWVSMNVSENCPRECCEMPLV